VPISLDLTEVPPVAIVRPAFQHVLHNLIQNGQQAGGDANHIAVSTSMHQQRVRIQIQDRGEGLSLDRLRTLFRPFTTTKKEGTGIGLYQCKATIEAAGGTIIVESRVGEGTVVSVELPAAMHVATGNSYAGGETVERKAS
jgi:two-component system NtrC family sensor kinase